jgi:hypothetical protein
MAQPRMAELLSLAAQKSVQKSHAHFGDQHAGRQTRHSRRDSDGGLCELRHRAVHANVLLNHKNDRAFGKIHRLVGRSGYDTDDARQCI